jgi:hypothetical protein
VEAERSGIVRHERDVGAFSIEQPAAVVEREEEPARQHGERRIGAQAGVELVDQVVGLRQRRWMTAGERARQDVAHALVRDGWQQITPLEHALELDSSIERQPAQLQVRPRREVDQPVAEGRSGGDGSELASRDPTCREPNPRERPIFGGVKIDHTGAPIGFDSRPPDHHG